VSTSISEQVDGQRLLLIDGLNIVRRVFEANPEKDLDKKVEGAIKNSVGSFRNALR
jgi:hypothetical protein